MGADFDFISGDDFRASLSSDYRELETAMAGGAWKAAHVLAGSIIEAMLVDYIVASKVAGVKDPLKLELGDAIGIARKEDAISERAAGLSHVIRNFRNLIHAGRVIRLGEKVDENSARVAKALVDMIIDEMSSSRAEEFGMTAEQLVGKLRGDPAAGAILKHLLDGLKRGELERLLLKVVPEEYLAESTDQLADEKYMAALGVCYRQAFEKATKDLKRRAAKDVADKVRAESGPVVAIYEEVFFRGPDLSLLSEEDRRLVKDHVVSRVDEGPTEGLLLASRGIGRALSEGELIRLGVVVSRHWIFSDKGLREAEAELLRDLYRSADEGLREKLRRVLTFWDGWLNERGRTADADAFKELRESLDADDIPF